MFSSLHFLTSAQTANYDTSQSADTHSSSFITINSSWRSISVSYADFFLRFSVALILLWYGAFKFTPSEAKAIEGLLRHSPFFGWMLNVLSLQSTSNLIGTIEIITAIALLIPRTSSLRILRILSWAGGILGAITFFATISFLFTTPNTWRVIDGLLVPVGAGGFLIKDIVLLAVCLHHLSAHNASTSFVTE